MAFTASVLATYTAFIFGANATRKSAKCDSFHYCAASHSAVNCLIDCWRLVRSSLTALVAISNNLSLSCHFSRVRLYSPFFAGDRHFCSILFWRGLARNAMVSSLFDGISIRRIIHPLLDARTGTGCIQTPPVHLHSRRSLYICSANWAFCFSISLE